MLDLFNIENLGSLPWLIMPFAVVLASFLGSYHCLVMCGAIATSVNPPGKSTTGLNRPSLYHVGRLTGYLLITAVLLLLGRELLEQTTLKLVALVTTVLISLYIVATGIALIAERKLRILPQSILNQLYKAFYRVKAVAHKTPWLPQKFSIGFLNAFIPCGWLYAFVLVAISFDHLAYALIFISLFWLGGLPVFYSLPLLLEKISLGRRQLLLGSTLIFFGLFTITVRAMPLLQQVLGNSGAMSCH